MDKRRHYEIARKRVQKQKGFFAHLATYTLVIGFLFLLNIYAGGPLWFWIPAAGWGLGLIFQGLDAFGLPGFSKDWEERQIRREMLRLEEEEEALRWEIRQARKAIDAPGNSEAELDSLDLEELREIRKNYRDEDLV